MEQIKKRIISQGYACGRFMRFVMEHFIQDECAYIASALAFTTILAIVPLMSVSLTVFYAFPVFQNMADPVQNFIFDNFVPAAGKVVQTYLQQFASQVSKLSIWGVTFLLITALLVMFNIERAMNKIWRARSSRQGIPAFLMYWAIISLAPVILGLSLAASSYLFSLPMLIRHPSPPILFNLAPFFLSLIGFTLLYAIVPNYSVKVRHAFWGGLIAAILFESAKQAFAYYLIRFNTYALLYGAFATVPLFFIWIYFVWIITLLGAEISYAFSVHHQRREGQPIDGFSHALLWLHQLWQGQQTGKGLNFNELIDASTQSFAVDVNEMIQSLSDHELIHATTDDYYMLSRDLNQITLYDLTQILPYKLPTQKELHYLKYSLAEQWKKPLLKNNENLQKSLNISLEELFRSSVEQMTKTCVSKNII